MNKNLHFLIAVLFLGMIGCNSSSDSGESTAESKKTEGTHQLTEINKLIESDLNNDDLYIKRADYYLSQNKVDSALRDILIAIDIDKENANHYITLSEAYLSLGNPDKCLDALNRALELDELNQEALIKKAQLYLIMRDYDNTYATLSELLEVDHINPVAYFVRAMAKIEQGDTTLAIKNLQVAIDQDQEYYEAQLQLGILQAARKNPVAVGYLQNAINIQPQIIEPYYQLGLFFQENNRLESAIQTYNSILDIEPEYVQAIYNLGYIQLVYNQNFPVAADYFSQVIQIAPEYAEAWYNRGYSYELMGQEKLARSDYQQTLKLWSNYNLAIEGLNRLDR